MTAIPLNQTTTLADLTPVTFALLLTDLLHLYRPTGGTPADYKVTVEQLRDYIKTGLLAAVDVVDNNTSTDTNKPVSANQVTILKGLIDALTQIVDGKLDASAYNEHYKGTYATASQLSTAHPTATAGDYAVVDLGVGQPAYLYTWDVDDNTWVQGSPMSPGSTDALAEGSTNLYFEAARAIAAGADAFIRFDEPQSLNSTQILQALENLGIAEFVNRPVGQIRLWAPETEYFTANAYEPPNMVYHQGQLYMVDADFISGLDFSIIDGSPSNVVLRRVRTLPDVDYMEISVSAIAPLVVNQRLGQYLGSKRRTNIYLNQILPHPDINNSGDQYHRAYCNAGITAPVTIDIVRMSRFAIPEEVVGTITINNDNLGLYNEGSFVVDDSQGQPTDNNIYIGRGDMLYFKLTSAPSGLEWICINMLAESPSYDSIDWNLPE